MRFRRFRPSPGTFIALIALFVALGGPAEAAKLISGAKIKPGTVTARQIATGTLTGKQIQDASVSKKELTERAVTQLQKTPDNTIGSFQLKSGAVTGSKLALASVGGAAIADGTLTGADLAPQSITAGSLAADSVGNTELADDSVGKTNLRSASVGKSELLHDSVGTQEVVDHDLHLADMAVFLSAATVNFDQPIAAGKCATRDSATPTYAISPGPNPAVSPLIVGQMSTDFTGIDTVQVSGRMTTAPGAAPGNVRITACNLGDAAVTPGAQSVPYLIFT
jgi:hypothetical protein